MHKLKIKIASLYCAQCAEQIASIVREHFRIKGIEFDIKDQLATISSYSDIEKNKLSKEIRKKGYGPVIFVAD